MKRHVGLLCGVLSAAVLVSFALLTHAARLYAAGMDAGVPEPCATLGPSTVADEADSYALFAQLSSGGVTRLSVVTPQSQYTFRCADETRVSVNGQKADRDVFLTLLDQILTMPVVTIPPFVPVDEATVTLTLVTDSAQYTAAFYRDGDEESPYMRIISGGADAPCYQRTDRWRLGTMLLACEGTRIQDEQGAETPMGND